MDTNRIRPWGLARRRTGEDKLGGLALTFADLEACDKLITRTAREQGIPVAIVLAGGYARDVEDTLAIHAAAAKVARFALLDSASK